MMVTSSRELEVEVTKALKAWNEAVGAGTVSKEGGCVLPPPNPDDPSTATAKATATATARASRKTTVTTAHPLEGLFSRSLATPKLLLPVGPAGRGEGTEEEALRCRPWDYGTFVQRLRTFTPTKWFAKSHREGWSPLQCARHGWLCTAKDQLRCGSCGAVLRYGEANRKTAPIGDNERNHTFSLPSNTPAPSLDASHEKLCPWRSNSCPPSFLHFPALPDEELRSGLRARLVSFSDCWLPEIHMPDEIAAAAAEFSPPSKLSSSLLGDLALSLLEKNEGLEGEGEAGGAATWGKDFAGQAFLLALCGWRLLRHHPNSPQQQKEEAMRSDGEPKTKKRSGCVFQCCICDRRIGNWNFASSEEVPCSSGVEAEDHKGKRRRRLSSTLLSALNPLSEHYSFCPWVGALSADSFYSSDGDESAAASTTSMKGGGGALVVQFQPGWWWGLRALLEKNRGLPDSEEERSGKDFFPKDSCRTAIATLNAVVHQ